MERTRAAVLVFALMGFLALPMPAQAGQADIIGHAGPAYTGCTSKSYTVSASLTGPSLPTYQKPADSCQDLNLMNADNGVHSDCYAGWYKTSAGWQRGAAGFVCKPNAPYFGSPVVLVSSIIAGTYIGVSSKYYSASIVVEY